MGKKDVEQEVQNATRYYWATLSDQEEAQLESEKTAGGRRSQVVGGSQMDGFAELYDEPNDELTFRRYLSSLVAHIKSHVDYDRPSVGEDQNDDSEKN